MTSTVTRAWSSLPLDIVASPDPIAPASMPDEVARALRLPIAVPSYRIEVRHDLPIIHAYSEALCPSFTGEGGAAIYLGTALGLLNSNRAFACPCMGLSL